MARKADKIRGLLKTALDARNRMIAYETQMKILQREIQTRIDQHNADIEVFNNSMNELVKEYGETRHLFRPIPELAVRFLNEQEA